MRYAEWVQKVEKPAILRVKRRERRAARRAAVARILKNLRILFV